jgi:hypothetical protein
MMKDRREARFEQLELKYQAVALREVEARKQAGNPVTPAYLHLIEMKHSSLATHEMACDALRKLDALGENGCVCWHCGEVYHKDEGYFLNKEYCSRGCYDAR